MASASEQLRRDFKASDDIRDAGLVTPPDVIRYDDIRYGEQSPWQALDVYRPRAAGEKRLPVIVSVHGGGWVYGDKERYQYYCMGLAQRGFAVVNFSYRLAPEYKYPAGIEDTNAVFSWVLAHGDEYRLDTAHVFAVGDSAGAHMLAIYSCLCADPAYAAGYPFSPPEGFMPTAIALNCGAYVMDAGREPLMAELLPGGGTAEEIERLQPLRHITHAFPPTFLMTASGDFLKGEAPLLAAKLAEMEVPFVYRYYVDGETPLGHVFHCNMRSAAGIRCNDEECAFFRSFL